MVGFDEAECAIESRLDHFRPSIIDRLNHIGDAVALALDAPDPPGAVSYPM